MKTCVVTASYNCPPAKVWLYLTNPNLNHWRTDLNEAEIDPDGAHMKEKNKDGSVTEIQILESEKPRRLRCTFTRGRIHGSFTAILLGGGDATSLECTMEVEGMGLFAKPRKGLEERLDMLHQALGD
ncbi:SRPBCC domain-containing protein [Gemmiger formicilis]|uniref:SRPBCC domain-containing protein n=1 Tax=Gemmiger formicilis TaxID=745368 RepID=UPI0019593485|nr:SRPBCC domain-containing protein [Gemmiger formicilis]MBM6716525.1 SRPBCC domain-containing protein [Gemmiger formicilis]